MLSTSTVWVAEEAAQPIGFVALCRDVVEHLYVHPECWGRRVGTQLIDTVRAEPLDKIALYGFQRNARARRFYEARGFKLKAFGNGVTNEAGEPDAYYEWHRRGSALAVF